MRNLAMALIALSLGSTWARAAESPKSKDKDAVSAESTNPSTAELSGQPAEDATDDLRRQFPGTMSKRPFEITAVWETHAGLIPFNIDHEGAGSSKVLNLGFLAFRWDMTKNNHLSVRDGIAIGAVADQGETGARATDLVLTFTRSQPLTRGFALVGAISATAPVSFHSQKAGLITAPSATIGASYHFKGLTAELRFFGGLYISKATSVENGGSPNPRGDVGGLVSLEYHLPFWKHRLAIGADFNDSYTWLYDVYGPPPSLPGSGQTGVINSPSQPVQQTYGGEAYVHLTIPDWKYLKFDVIAAYASGGPGLGYESRLHDGVAHVYPFYWRTNSNVYLSLAAHY